MLEDLIEIRQVIKEENGDLREIEEAIREVKEVDKYYENGKDVRGDFLVNPFIES